MGIAEPFERVARDELKLTRRALEGIRNSSATVLERAAAQHAAEA